MDQYDYRETTTQFKLLSPFDPEKDHLMVIGFDNIGLCPCPFTVGSIVYLLDDSYKILDITQAQTNINAKVIVYYVEVEKISNPKSYIEDVNKLERLLVQ